MALEDNLRIEWVDTKTAWEEDPGAIYGIWMSGTAYADIIDYIRSIPPERRKDVVVAGWLRPLTEAQQRRLTELGVRKYDISYGFSLEDPDISSRQQAERRILDLYRRDSRPR